MGLLRNILATSPVIGSALQAHDQARTAQLNARLTSAVAGMQAQVANFNADNAIRYGELNAGIITAVGGINTRLTAGIADLNLGMISATTDFNVSMIGATSEFNARAAEGSAAILEARGGMEAAVHEGNAMLLEANAQIALDQGAQQERVSRLQYAQVKSRQRAAMAANGVALDEGSALRVQSDTDYLSDVDADTIKTNAIRAAWGQRVQAANEMTQASFARINGKTAALDKRMEAVATRLQASVGQAQARLEGSQKSMDIRLTSSFQIIQNEMSTAIGAVNARSTAAADAWNFRTQALGYNAAALQARYGASRIDPLFNAIAAGSQAATSVALAFVGG